VAATGTAPLTYQWKKNGTAISGATSSSYTNTSDNEFGQWSAVHRDGQQLDGQCDQHRSHAHGQRRCGGAFDHNAAGQPDR